MRIKGACFAGALARPFFLLYSYHTIHSPRYCIHPPKGRRGKRKKKSTPFPRNAKAKAKMCVRSPLHENSYSLLVCQNHACCPSTLGPRQHTQVSIPASFRRLKADFLSVRGHRIQYRHPVSFSLSQKAKQMHPQTSHRQGLARLWVIEVTDSTSSIHLSAVPSHSNSSSPPHSR